MGAETVTVSTSIERANLAGIDYLVLHDLKEDESVPAKARKALAAGKLKVVDVEWVKQSVIVSDRVRLPPPTFLFFVRAFADLNGWSCFSSWRFGTISGSLSWGRERRRCSLPMRRGSLLSEARGEGVNLRRTRDRVIVRWASWHVLYVVMLLRPRWMFYAFDKLPLTLIKMWLALLLLFTTSQRDRDDRSCIVQEGRWGKGVGEAAARASGTAPVLVKLAGSVR
jgi:hypothetical protein